MPTGSQWGDLRVEHLGRPTRKWEANIKMDLQELGWGGLYWIDLAEDRDRWAGCCEYANELSGCKKGGQFLDQLGICQLLKKMTLLHGVSQIVNQFLVRWLIAWLSAQSLHYYENKESATQST